LDHRAGTIAAAIWEVYRDRDIRSEPFGPHDFFSSLPKPEHKPVSVREAKRNAEIFFKQLDKIKHRLPAARRANSKLKVAPAASERSEGS
jgi:hypothetical protein